jgi:hypothetical protein
MFTAEHILNFDSNNMLTMTWILGVVKVRKAKSKGLQYAISC